MKINCLDSLQDFEFIHAQISDNPLQFQSQSCQCNIDYLLSLYYQDFNHRYGIEGINISLLDKTKKNLIPYKLYNPVLAPEIIEQIYRLKIPLDQDGGITAYAVQCREPVFVSEFKSAGILSNLGKNISSLTRIQGNVYFPLLNGEEVLGIITFPSYSHPLRLSQAELEDFFRNIQYFSISVISVMANSKLQLLYKEMHHRVKNNFQIVSHLVSTEMLSITDPHVINILKKTNARIINFSLLHNALLKSEDFTTISLKTHLHELIDTLMPLLNNAQLTINLSLQIDDLYLEAQRATYISLIVNELITNALKYAFTGMKQGKIQLSLTKTKDHFISFQFSDNGVGLPHDFNLKNSNSFGIDLISNLVEMLGGEMKIFSAEGTFITILLPLEA